MAVCHEDSMFTCIICGKSGMSEDEMKFHITVEHDENPVCPYCDQIWETTEQRDKHVNVEHRDFFDCSPSDHDEQRDIDKLYISTDTASGEQTMVNGHPETNLNEDISSPFAICEDNEESSNNLNSDFKEAGSIMHGGYEPISSSASTDLQTEGDRDKENMSCEDGRSKLFLDVPSTSGSLQSCSASVQPGVDFSCPFCSFSTTSEISIEQHVNREHHDILSPAKNGAECMNVNNYMMLYSCPFCAASLDTPRLLEAHISAVHADALSPGTSQMPDSGGNLFVCPVCEKQCPDPQSLSRHVDGHFSAEQTPDRAISDKQLAEEIHRQELEAANRDNKDFESLQVRYGMDERTSYKQQYEQSLERAVRKGDISIVEYHTQKATLQTNDLSGVDDGHSCTKGLIPRLQYYHTHTPGFVSRSWLCPAVDHYCGSYGDKGWGCGYRNLQMLLSSLVHDPAYCRVLFNDRPIIPSIPKIQRLIETAWEKGFDRQGCEQLGGRVVNTRKWIGATEIVALLAALKIKCKLLDFQCPSGKDSTHPKLFEWVKNYFENQDVFKPPLYLQHQGHSRTVIGVEEMKDKSLRLLMFDPGSAKRHMEQFYGKVTGGLMKSLRRGIYGLRAKQYQIVAVIGILTDQEYEEHKMLKSEKIS